MNMPFSNNYRFQVQSGVGTQLFTLIKYLESDFIICNKTYI